jgi:mono/diheme cytochrome c family protein
VEELCAGSAFLLPGSCYLVAVAGHAMCGGRGGDARRGQAIFLQDCQGCHGPDGKGGGKGFMPHVGPLARKGYIETLPDDYLADVIAEGGAAAGKSAFMPSWKNTLTPQDIADVVAFIRTLVVE